MGQHALQDHEVAEPFVELRRGGRTRHDLMGADAWWPESVGGANAELEGSTSRTGPVRPSISTVAMRAVVDHLVVVGEQ